MHLIKSQLVKSQRSSTVRSRIAQRSESPRNHQVPPQQRDERTCVAVAKTLERAEIEEARTMVYGIKEEDVEWLKQSLVGVISFNMDYVAIKPKLLRSGMELIDFKLLGASQAVLITYMIL